MTGNESICVKCREHLDVNQPYLQPFKKILTVNTGMVMVNYKKYGFKSNARETWCVILVSES